jgi:hypothetical protein
MSAVDRAAWVSTSTAMVSLSLPNSPADPNIDPTGAIPGLLDVATYDINTGTSGDFRSDG